MTVKQRHSSKVVRPKKSYVAFIRYTLLFFFIGGLSYGSFRFFTWDFLEVRQIVVSGEVSLSRDDISNKVKQDIIASQKPWYPAAHILLVPVNKIEKSLFFSYPRIKNVKIVKAFPNQLYVRIEERSPVWKTCNQLECRGVSSEGVLIDRVSTATSYPRLELGRSPLPGEELLTLQEVNWVQGIQSYLNERMQITPPLIKAVFEVDNNIKVLQVYLDDDTYILIACFRRGVFIYSGA
jgi:hypothetical protein